MSEADQGAARLTQHAACIHAIRAGQHFLHRKRGAVDQGLLFGLGMRHEWQQREHGGEKVTNHAASPEAGQKARRMDPVSLKWVRFLGRANMVW